MLNVHEQNARMVQREMIQDQIRRAEDYLDYDSATSACNDGRHELCGNKSCQCACHDDITPEVCVRCGNYFNYLGGVQLCSVCKAK